MGSNLLLRMSMAFDSSKLLLHDSQLNFCVTLDQWSYLEHSFWTFLYKLCHRYLLVWLKIIFWLQQNAVEAGRYKLLIVICTLLGFSFIETTGRLLLRWRPHMNNLTIPTWQNSSQGLRVCIPTLFLVILVLVVGNCSGLQQPLLRDTLMQWNPFYIFCNANKVFNSTAWSYSSTHLKQLSQQASRHCIIMLTSGCSVEIGVKKITVSWHANRVWLCIKNGATSLCCIS